MARQTNSGTTYAWIPAFAGMTDKGWIPVCTGMTKKETNRIPAFAGMTDRVMDAGLHRHDGQWWIPAFGSQASTTILSSPNGPVGDPVPMSPSATLRG